MPTPTQTPNAGQAAHTPTRETIIKLFDRHNDEFYAMVANAWYEHASEASVNRHYDESIIAEKAFLDALNSLCNTHASLVEALELIAGGCGLGTYNPAQVAVHMQNLARDALKLSRP